MAFKIGFQTDFPKDPIGAESSTPVMTTVPRKSVVEVAFFDEEVTYSYFNDRFALKVGDRVYVEGRLEGNIGRVVSVNYNFKIKLSDYKKVIALVDTEVHGTFFHSSTHMITFDPSVLPPQKASLWFKAPTDSEEEFVYSTDESTFLLEKLEGMKIISAILERGLDYYTHNRIPYLSLDGTHGYAIVKGSEAYEVEFEYARGEISNIVCSCFCGYHCKHEVAALLLLKELLDTIEEHYKTDYEQTHSFVAMDKEVLFSYVLSGNNPCSVIL